MEIWLEFDFGIRIRIYVLYMYESGGQTLTKHIYNLVITAWLMIDPFWVSCVYLPPTVTLRPYECHGVSSHRQLNYLFNRGSCYQQIWFHIWYADMHETHLHNVNLLIHRLILHHHRKLLQRMPLLYHHNDVIIIAMASQITSLTVVYSNVYSSTDQRKHQSCASLALVRGIHRWAVNSSVTRKMLPFDDVIMFSHDIHMMAVRHT